MKEKTPTLIVILFLFVTSTTYAQLSTQEPPISFSLGPGMLDRNKTIQTITMPELDMVEIEKEDADDAEDDISPRFGFQHVVNFNLNNSGIWYKLPNGDKLWQLNIVCPKALSVNFCFDRFWLPEGGKFFVYSKDRKHSIGAFTNKNNKGDRDNIRGFATGLVYGDDVILEYYQPKDVTSDAIISIEYVVHGYRFVYDAWAKKSDGGSCMVNINCEEGQEWQNEKKGVAMILVNGNRICTGSLINTTNLSQEPFFLTANHCIKDYGDASGNVNLDYFTFYWNYEAPGCANINTEPNFYVTSGASIIANNSFSDFALLRLSEDPQNLTNYIPYYLGWDNSGLCGDAGVCIHHPQGSVKKVSTVATQPTAITFPSYPPSPITNHWNVTWKSTINGHGTTNKGSSGSPLLNSTHKVIGQLHGSTCFGCNNLNGESRFGKFDVSWSGYGNDSICRRINCWLDSIGTGTQSMEGLLVIPTTVTINEDQQMYSNIRITCTGQLTIQSDMEFMDNSRVIVESGGQLIIDGGTLSVVDIILKSGASLQIINGGLLNITNGFKAPLGAIVYLEHGQIL